MKDTNFSTGEEFDDILKCARLRRATKDVEPYLDLVPIHCLRGNVQILRCSNALSMPTERKDTKDEWESDVFFIDRFCSSSSTKEYNLKDSRTDEDLL